MLIRAIPTCRRVDVSEGQNFVLLCFECLLDLLLRNSSSNLGFDLIDFGTICLETKDKVQMLSHAVIAGMWYIPILKAISKISAMQDERVLPRFYQIGCNLVPSQGT